MPLIECSVSSSATCPWKTGVLGIYKAKGDSINGVANNRQSRLEGKAEALISPENGRDFPLINKSHKESTRMDLCCVTNVSGVLPVECSHGLFNAVYIPSSAFTCSGLGCFPAALGRCCLGVLYRAQGGTSSVLWGAEAPVWAQ